MKAKANEGFAAALDVNNPVACCWAVTVLFYVAVHYVQAYFSSLDRSYSTHTTRAAAIHKDSKIRVAYDNYRELENMSREARYECTNFDSGAVKYARECLDQVRKAVNPFL